LKGSLSRRCLIGNLYDSRHFLLQEEGEELAGKTSLRRIAETPIKE